MMYFNGWGDFKFFGFLPRKRAEREQLIVEICTSGITSVVFESGKRIGKLLNDISLKLPKNTKVLVAREMTKIYETFYRGTPTQIRNEIESSEYGTKGEFVLIISAFDKFQIENFTDEDKRIMDILWESLPQKEALSLATKILKKKRNFLYKNKIGAK